MCFHLPMIDFRTNFVVRVLNQMMDCVSGKTECGDLIWTLKEKVR